MRRKKLTRIDEKRRLPLRCLLHLYHPMTIITVNIFIFLVIIKYFRLFGFKGWWMKMMMEAIDYLIILINGGILKYLFF